MNKNIQKEKSFAKTKTKQPIHSKDKNKIRLDCKRLFHSLDSEKDGYISASSVVKILEEAGILKDDPRMKHFYSELKKIKKDKINFDEFSESVQGCELLLEKALSSNFVIPDFPRFTQELEEIYRENKTNNIGKVADYIPELIKVHADKFAISICTVDGQRWSIGDSKDNFSLESTSKIWNYCLSLEEFGVEEVHRYVGREPSGQNFNEIILDSSGRPHNPMINAGAIVTASMVRPSLKPEDRLNFWIDTLKKASGNMETPYLNNSVYLSEKETADRNYALAYFIKENKSFPENFNMEETLNFYMQCCSVDMSTGMLAMAASTLASSGVCSMTSERIFETRTVKKCLSLMFSCGLYNYSGEFAFKVGIPAKSGVSGCTVAVIPNLMGICIWSPRLDSNGNSVRGVQVCKDLVSRYNFHVYDSLESNSEKRDPSRRETVSEVERCFRMIWAACRGDLEEIKKIRVLYDGSINIKDYDGRTPLHLAVAEGRVEVVEYFLEEGVDIDVADRWGETPLAAAKTSGQTRIIEMLEAAQSGLKSSV